MTTILLSMMVVAAVATAAYIVILKRRSKSEWRNLDKELRAEFEKRIAAEANVEGLKKANQQQRADADSKNAQIKALEGKVTELDSSLQNTCKDLRELQNKYHTLTENKASLEAQLSQLQEKIEKRKEDYEFKISLLSAHNNEFRTNCNTLQNELRDLRGELEAVTSRFEEEGNVHLAIREKAEKEQIELLAVNEDLSKKLKISQTEYENGSQCNQALEQELVEKKTLIETLQNQISTKETMIDETRQEIDKLIKDTESLVNSAREKQSIIDGQFEDAKKLREEINELINEKVIRNSAFKNLEADYELKKETIKSLEEENINLKGKIDAREEDISDLHRQVEKLERKKSEPEARIKKLENQVPTKESDPEEQLKKREPGGGGRPRGTPVTVHTQEKTLNHQLRCWKAEGSWSVGIELLNLIDDLVIDKVVQKEILLNRDDNRENCWFLNNLRDDIDISWVSSDSLCSKTVTISNGPYLLFKLHGEYFDYGRHVRQLRWGAPTLMILSNDWKVGDECKNIVGLGEQVAFDDYTAYCIYSLDDTHDHLTLTNKYDGVRDLALERPVFLLEGNRLRNDDRNSCPIFGSQLPEIRISKGTTWTDISTILIGEEGPGRNKWHSKFVFTLDKQAQQIPHAVEGVKISNGWYYLRFYDQNYTFVDSLDFLYVESINQIKAFGSFFPKEQGHTTEEIQFHHNNDCMIISKSHPDRLIPEHTHYGTVVRVPPQSCFDVTKWSIVDSSSREYDVMIELDRIWWALGYESIPPKSWTDKYLEASLDNFKATSERCLWVKIPSEKDHKISREINAGFSNLAMYTFKPKDNTCYLPLRIYGDSIFNHNKMGKIDFILSCESQSRSIMTLKVKGKCSFCEQEEREENGILKHFRMAHEVKVSEDSFYRQLTYAEIRTIKQYSHIPSAVYKCAYCDHCVDADDRSKSPTSAILSHFESDNKDLCKAAKVSNSGFRVPTFGVMTDVNAINAIMNKNLPIIYRCTACRRDIYERDSNSKENRLEHIINKHKNKLYTLI